MNQQFEDKDEKSQSKTSILARILMIFAVASVIIGFIIIKNTMSYDPLMGIISVSSSILLALMLWVAAVVVDACYKYLKGKN